MAQHRIQYYQTQIAPNNKVVFSSLTKKQIIANKPAKRRREAGEAAAF